VGAATTRRTPATKPPRLELRDLWH
jgi:hypothetical protein